MVNAKQINQAIKATLKSAVSWDNTMPQESQVLGSLQLAHELQECPEKT